jgi:superfamily I DNA/RNA helicase
MWINFQDTIEQRLGREILDQEQSKAKNFSLNAHALVRGVAGSGKSLILRNRVEKIIEAGMTNILVLSYNRFMNGWLRSKLAEKGIELEQCSTFHKWSYPFGYTFAHDEDNDNGKRLRENFVERMKNSSVKYDAILIDEAQDFYDEWYQAVLAVLNPETNSLFFVYDNTQSVYGQSHRRKDGWSWKKLGINVQGRSLVIDLKYRNSPEILETAWKFILLSLEDNEMTIGDRKKSYGSPAGSIIIPIKKSSRSSNIQPQLIQVNSGNMSRQIAEQVKLALDSYPESSIGILTHPRDKSTRQRISQELWNLGVKHHAPMSSQERDKNVVDRPYVIVDSWNALKGVEFDAVIIAGVDKAHENLSNPEADFTEKAGIYTAMTRARDHVVILYNQKTSMVELIENALNSPDVLDFDKEIITSQFQVA